ncbi:Uncharacterised protein [BD1-7 clade bacterium]|uniref:Uncharacterized protein n=1 Tax=BD1-7 clade bacterium TaxID=2029982 RepID=A0A5S9NND6_9GAMM|nr:Uncharacterised protein [BD1-7 clade bacterium]
MTSSGVFPPGGFGNHSATVRVYLPNPPPVNPFNYPEKIRPLSVADQHVIVTESGNHWRKIFVILAKLGLKFRDEGDDWRAYRASRLLSADGEMAVLFSPPNENFGGVHIVAGKACAELLGVADNVVWLDRYFAVDKVARLIVCPYLDYRQLSDARLDRLLELVASLR